MQDKTNGSRVWKLKIPLTFTRPRFWNVHQRYALLLGGEEVLLNPDAWLLELGPNLETVQTPGQEPRVEYLYRLATGETVALDHALTPDEAWLEDHPQAIAAMTAYRTLNQAIPDDWGLVVDHIASTPPFAIIKCPICACYTFTSIDFTAVYCTSCNTSFSLRQTGGDEGFVAEARLRYTWLGTARYLIPRTENLVLCLVYKNGGDPREEPTGKNLRPEQLAQTDETHPSLQPGLYNYNLGDLYGWNLNGLVPTLQELDQNLGSGYTWKIDGAWWPLSAHVRISGLTDHQHTVLARHLSALQADEANQDEMLQEVLTDLGQRLPNRRVFVNYRAQGLPPLKDLAENQRYLLREWLIGATGKVPDRLTAAYPVWYVVEPILSPTHETDPAGYRRIEGWQVIRRDNCPVCYQQVSSQEMVFHAEASRQHLPINADHDWSLPHGQCREVWEEGKWPLYQRVVNAIQDLPPEEPVELPTRYWLVLRTNFSEKTQETPCLFAVVYLSPELVGGLFWWSQVAQQTEQGITCIGADHGLRLPSYLSLEEAPPWKDCFTGLTLAEQNGYAVLNNYPVGADEIEKAGIQQVVTQHPWISYAQTGEIGWSAQLPPPTERGIGKNIETAAFPPQALKQIAGLMGITGHWEEKHRRVAEVMTQPIASDPAQEIR